MPYDLYIDFCMWFWSRRSWGGRRFAPQINQLGFGRKSEAAWRAEFDKFVPERLSSATRSLAELPQMHPTAFQATTEQNAARDFVLRACGTSGRPWAELIEMWCLSYPVLTPDCFAMVAPEVVIADAMETLGFASRISTSEPEPLPLSALWPTCHGMPGAHSPDAQVCLDCKFSDSCVALSALVKKEVIRTTGHEHPRWVQLRAPKNAPQARHRARKKASTPPDAGIELIFPIPLPANVHPCRRRPSREVDK